MHSAGTHNSFLRSLYSKLPELYGEVVKLVSLTFFISEKYQKKCNLKMWDRILNAVTVTLSISTVCNQTISKVRSNQPVKSRYVHYIERDFITSENCFEDN